MTLPFTIFTAEEAAHLIEDGSTVAFSGFTPAGSAKGIPVALARKANREHAAGRPFAIGVLTGASTGPSLDGVLAEAQAIRFRTPYQANGTLRKQINAGQVRFVDMHLSMLPQTVRYGFLGPIHWAVVEPKKGTHLFYYEYPIRNKIDASPCAPCQGGDLQWVKLPPGNSRSSR